jgi:hypothetical protein
MELYQITFHNDEYSTKKTDATITINLYASDPISATKLFVDLAFDQAEPYQTSIRSWLLAIVTHIYDDGLSIMESYEVTDGVPFHIWGSVSSKTDPMIIRLKNEYDDMCAYYLASCYRDKEEDKFLDHNKEDFKVVLERYLEELDSYIRIVPLRISNRPTVTKPAK